ncbi:MAG: DegT/DnrJ/EryC1/StrS family aminotransferase [Planctomycetes bacterium]|nr:DegT/DnrJ/EryC1/StrS family aminotransferase [Planctomycetota bacterium]
MSGQNVSRRRFISEASAGAAVAVTAGVVGACGDVVKKADKLAALGGTPVRTEPYPKWPQPTTAIEESLVSTFRSGSWGRRLGEGRHGVGQVGLFEKRFAELIGTKHCLATGSCTQALHTALHSVGVGAGDEVLVTPCTYIASIQAVLLCDALPVFVDVDIDTFQMDPDKIEPLVNENTRAVEPVHIGGLPCDMGRIMAVADKHDLKVVEDAAQAHLAEFKGKKCGTFGDLGCFSFQTSKVIACGEGGAIVGNDEEVMEKCYAFHNIGMGTTRGSVGIGTKYRMNEFEAAVLNPQFATLPEQTQTRNENAAYLARRLEEIPGIAPQKLHDGFTKGAYYIYGFRYQKEHFNDAPKEKFLRALRGEGLRFTTMYFDQLNTQPFIENALNSRTFQKVFSTERLNRYREQNHCPSNDQLHAEGVWLPQYAFLGSKKLMDEIADAMVKIHDNRDQLAKL